jgi:hypothetical protein
MLCQMIRRFMLRCNEDGFAFAQMEFGISLGP